jgi:hypothetical protein
VSGNWLLTVFISWQVENISSTDVQILVDVLRKTIPEGVSLSVHEHTEEHFEARHIPDPFIEGLKAELKVFEDQRQKIMEEKAKELAAKKK